MVEVPDFRQMGEALGDACAVLRSNAASAGLDAPVPTCPGWSVRDLVVHTSVVHRWGASHLRAETPRTEANWGREASEVDDLLDWFDDGMVELLNTVVATDADAEVWFFLPNGPRPRDAWLRRQVHETTIHGVDAMAARLGRTPRSDETRVPDWLGLDGLDELLVGMAGHPRRALGAAHGTRMLVAPSDADRAWLLTIGAERTRIERVEGGVAHDARLTGTARALYLALWNRGDEAECDRPGWLDAWRSSVRIAWQ